MIDLTTKTARTIAEAVRRRELTAVAVAQSALERIGQLNATLHAFITVTRDEALAAAEQVDQQDRRGPGRQLAAGGRPDGDQGQLLDQGGPRPRAARRCSPTSSRRGRDGRGPAQGGRLRAGRQVGDARDGLRLHQPEPALRRLPQSVGHVPNSRREQRRQRRGAGHRDGARGRRRRHRRLEPAAGGPLRRRRREGHLRPRQPAWRHSASWSMDTVGPMARTVGDAAAHLAGHGRVRPQGSDHPPRRRSRLPGRARRRA